LERRALILKCSLAPGDLCTITSAIESLHAQYPGRFLTDVRTSCDEIFLHNPWITPLADTDAEYVSMHYGDIQTSNDRPSTFIGAYTRHLEKYLGMPLPALTNRPHLYLSADEKDLPNCLREYGFASGMFWVICAGIKSDFTLKQWPVEYYQAVVRHFRGRVRFVQVGSSDDEHPALDGVINLVGRTGHRDLMRVCFHAAGGVGPITYIQHLCAAFEKPYLALLGGREPVMWTQYPLQRTLHTLGMLTCCRTKACWKSRVVVRGDGEAHDRSLCELPVLDFSRPVGQCMALIRPTEVIAAIESCLAREGAPPLSRCVTRVPLTGGG
jgi:ADP-heptose:LPS heptosyltransferase